MFYEIVIMIKANAAYTPQYYRIGSEATNPDGAMDDANKVIRTLQRAAYTKVLNLKINRDDMKKEMDIVKNAFYVLYIKRVNHKPWDGICNVEHNRLLAKGHKDA